MGLTVGAVIASTTTGGGDNAIEHSSKELENGYKATFWACFTSMMLVSLVSLLGLKKAGKVGLKKE